MTNRQNPLGSFVGWILLGAASGPFTWAAVEHVIPSMGWDHSGLGPLNSYIASGLVLGVLIGAARARLFRAGAGTTGKHEEGSAEHRTG